MLSEKDFPSVDDVVNSLTEINTYDTEDEDGISVRLQVYEDGQWAVRWGLSDYDQDHREYWGVSSVDGNNNKSCDFKAIAANLIEECKEHAAVCGDLKEDD